MKRFNYGEGLLSKLSRVTSPRALWQRVRLRWPWKFSLDPFPRSVGIEVTNRCNLNCVMCHREKMTRAEGSMEWDLFTEAADQAIAGGARVIVPFNYGESLLHPELPRMVAYIKAHGSNTQVKLNTNGVLMTPALAAELMSAGIDEITFSIEGATAETHERLARGSSLETVLNNLDATLRERNRAYLETRVRLCMVRMEDNVDELRHFIEHWKRLVDHITIHDVNTGAGALEDRRVEKLPLKRKHPCRELWGKLIVLWNGDVTLCCVDFDGHLKIGSLADGDRLDTLWTCEALATLRRHHRTRTFEGLPLCSRCDSDDTL